MISLTKKRTRSTGFTLIELMVSVAIFSILTAVVSGIGLAMMNSTQMVDAKVKMRDEARTAMTHMVRNLRMAGTAKNGKLITYRDANGTTQTWPPPAGTSVDNITFSRPFDLNKDGIPISNQLVEWTDDVDNPTAILQITFRLDTAATDRDGNLLQLVQLRDGNYDRVLANDISPVVNAGAGGPFDTPAAGGISFSDISTSADETVILITFIQRRTYGMARWTLVTRYEDAVAVRN